MIGIEREILRINQDGTLATTPHPKSLTNPQISLDFGEAQLELITPPLDSYDQVEGYLERLHFEVAHAIKDELLWPLSMPPPLPKEVQVATSLGPKKEAYRLELAKRYGVKMQLISGIHLNISCEEDPFSAMRHFLSKGWILTYFFGASPTTDYSTSTRMSTRGYYSKVQQQLKISYDSRQEYEADLLRATQTPHPKFPGALLLSPAEHYTRIRPKDGYVEIRSLDLNPYSPIGVTKKQVDYTIAFFNYCRSLPPEPLEPHHTENQNRVALHGRDPHLKLLRNGSEIPIQKWLEEMVNAIDCAPPTYLLSEKIANESEGFALELAKKYKEEYLLEASSKLVINEARKRGLSVSIIDGKESLIKVENEYIKQATKTSKDSYISTELMSNKEVTKKILRSHGINVPATLTSVKQKAIIKPTHANYGLGISIISSQDEVEAAKKLALQYSDSYFIEEYFEGIEHRILIIDGKIIGIVKREPANVIGDGVSTITELAAIKNKTKLYPILEKSDHIPKLGEKVFLRKNSNVSTGGDAISVDLPDRFKNIALRAARAVGATFCGVDMIINGDDYTIIELNYNPAIWMHAYPHEGQPAPVASAILDFVLSNKQSISSL